MKKSISKKIVVLLVMLVMAGGAMFAATEQSLDLAGTVTNQTSLTLTSAAGQNAGEFTEAITYNAATAWDNVGSLNAKTNNFGGYEITVASANGFTLVGGNTAVAIGYELSAAGANGKADVDADGVLVGGAEGALTGTQTPAAGIDHQLSVAVDAPAPDTVHAVDTYTDTLTFTIAIN